MDFGRQQDVLAPATEAVGEYLVDAPGNPSSVEESDAEIECQLDQADCIRLGSTFHEPEAAAAPAPQSDDTRCQTRFTEADVFHRSGRSCGSCLPVIPDTQGNDER